MGGEKDIPDAILTALHNMEDEAISDLNEVSDGLEAVVERLSTKKKIGLEFECGDCCKKVLNGAKLFFYKGVAILFPRKGDCLFLKLFSGGNLVDEETMRAIIIPVKRICSIEIEPVEVESFNRLADEGSSSE